MSAGGAAEGIAFGEDEGAEYAGDVAVYSCYEKGFAVAGWDGHL